MRMDNGLSSSGRDVDSVDLNDFQSDAELQLAIARLNNSSLSPRSRLEQEKRLRREIANSNERRRMQSINAGFQSLKNLLPRKDGDKMSKASILQQTAEYIFELKADKAQLLQQNIQLKQLLELREAAVLSGSVSPSSALSVTLPTVPQPETPPTGQQQRNGTTNEKDDRPSFPDHLEPPKKRKKFGSSASSDEGICLMSDVDGSDGRTHSSPEEAIAASDLLSPVNHHANVNLSGFLQNFQGSAMHPSPPQPHLNELPPSFATSKPPESAWGADIVQHTLYELRLALERERASRLLLEDHFKAAEVSARLQQELPRYTGVVGQQVTSPPISSHSMFTKWRQQQHQLFSSAAEDNATIKKSQLPLSSVALTSSSELSENGCSFDKDIRNTLNTATSLAFEAHNNAKNQHLQQLMPQPMRHSVDALVAAANGILRPTAISLASAAALAHQSQAHAAAVAASSALPNSFCRTTTANDTNKDHQSHAATALSQPQLQLAFQQATSSVLAPLAANSSVTKQNLEAIVEAIRHLEGDQLFVDTTGSSSILRMSRAALAERDSGGRSPERPAAAVITASINQFLEAGGVATRPHIIMSSAAS